MVDDRDEAPGVADDDKDDNNDNEEAGRKDVTIDEARHHIERLLFLTINA